MFLLWIIYVISVLFLLCFRVPLSIDALWSPAGKGLTSWLSFVMSNCEVVTFPLVSWVRCGALLYQFLVFALFLTFYAPAIYNGGGGHIASPLSVRPYVLSRTYENGFRAISFENIGVLDSYFIHRYIIIKYRSSSIMDEIHQLLSELRPLTSE